MLASQSSRRSTCNTSKNSAMKWNALLASEPPALFRAVSWIEARTKSLSWTLLPRKVFPAKSAPGDRAALLAEEHKLSRLRELALLVAASVIDRQLESYLRSHGMDSSWGVQERILVCVTPRSNAAKMLESGRRNADRFQGEFYVVYVQQPVLSQQDRQVLQQNLDYARQLGAQVEVLSGLDATDAILKFARQKGITQIFVGHSMREGGWRRLWGNSIKRLIRSAEGIDVVVYPH